MGVWIATRGWREDLSLFPLIAGVACMKMA